MHGRYSDKSIQRTRNETQMWKITVDGIETIRNGSSNVNAQPKNDVINLRWADGHVDKNVIGVCARVDRRQSQPQAPAENRGNA